MIKNQTAATFHLCLQTQLLDPEEARSHVNSLIKKRALCAKRAHSNQTL